MSQHEGLGYSAIKIGIILLVLTVLEVFWGMTMRDFGRVVLWGGLLAFAFAKGILILMYFMHMKFEKMIVWCLILPTPLLIAVVLFALMPDISMNNQLDNPIGSMRSEAGQVVGLALEAQHGAHAGEAHGEPGAAEPAAAPAAAEGH